MPYVDFRNGEDPSIAIWTVRPEQGKAALESTDANWKYSILTTREREAARHRVAQLNGCITCQNWRIEGFDKVGVDDTFFSKVEKGRNDPYFSRREQLAIEMAERFSLDWTNIGDDFMDEIRKHYKDEELVDLLICIGQYVGQGRMIHILGVDQVCPMAPASMAIAR